MEEVVGRRKVPTFWLVLGIPGIEYLLYQITEGKQWLLYIGTFVALGAGLSLYLEVTGRKDTGATVVAIALTFLGIFLVVLNFRI